MQHTPLEEYAPPSNIISVFLSEDGGNSRILNESNGLSP